MRQMVKETEKEQAMNYIPKGNLVIIDKIFVLSPTSEAQAEEETFYAHFHFLHYTVFKTSILASLPLSYTYIYFYIKSLALLS